MLVHFEPSSSSSSNEMVFLLIVKIQFNETLVRIFFLSSNFQSMKNMIVFRQRNELKTSEANQLKDKKP